MKTVRLRYTGDLPKTFSTCNVGSVEQGDEFDVPEDMAERFTVRADIEVVGGSRGKPRRAETNDSGTGADTGAETGDQGAANPDGATGDPAADTLV